MSLVLVNIVLYHLIYCEYDGILVLVNISVNTTCICEYDGILVPLVSVNMMVY